MAISLKTAGTWARMVTDGGSVTIPGSPSDGDRVFLFGSWKTYTITVATPGSGSWTLINDFSDGTTAAGNGTGSVHNAVYYRTVSGGITNPTIDYSAVPTEGHWVCMLWQKGAGETWDEPLSVNQSIPADTAGWTAQPDTTLNVPDGAVVMALVGFRDDSALMTRPTDGILEASSLITWNGNYVESPATHFSSTTGQDMSGDLGHRFVTTGHPTSLVMAIGTLSAAESGAYTAIVQGVTTAAEPLPTKVVQTPQLLQH